MSTTPSARADYSLRRMTEADIPAVSALENRLFPVDAWPLQMFFDELSQPETREYWVAEVPGEMTTAEPVSPRIIGYAGLMCIPPIADIQTIAVVPEQEGRGIGTALLKKLIDGAISGGADDVLLEVREDNPRAQDLYVRHGFEHIHTRKKYYRDGVDARIMRLELAQLRLAQLRLAQAEDAQHETKN